VLSALTGVDPRNPAWAIDAVCGSLLDHTTITAWPFRKSLRGDHTMQLGTVASVIAAIAILTCPSIVQAQRAPYGPPITLDQAKRVMAAADSVRVSRYPCPRHERRIV
jgi:hypothetical protein